MLIDTHCHLNFDSYDTDRAAVIDRAQANGVTRIIIPATDLTSGAQGIQLAVDYPHIIYAAVGIHPNSTKPYQASHLQQIRQQALSHPVVAIGEIGLDYYRDRSPKATQWRAFEEQLALAAELNLPVIIHNREAHEDVLAILARWVATLPVSLQQRPGVLHSFSAPQSVADQALVLGFYLGFTGPVTYKNAQGLRLTATSTPVERILVETDGPFLTPVPHRGERNEPAYVAYVAERIAQERAMPLATLQAVTTANAERLFNLPVLS